MHKRNERRFSPIHVIMLLISCLTLMGCYRPDWSDKDADFLIIQAKTNEDEGLRCMAVRLLAEKTQERDKVIPALTRVLLNDEYTFVRVAAVESLGRLEPPAISAIPALIEALQREDSGCLDVVYSEHPDFHKMVMSLLGEMGADAAEAIPALTEVFLSGEEYLRYIRDDAGVAILKIDPSMHTVKEELIERRAVWQLAELAEAGDVSLVPVLIQSLNDPDPPHGSTPVRAERALKNIGTPEALEAVVAYHIQRLDHPGAGARVSAAESLEYIGTPEALDAAVPVLIQLLDAPETWVRKRAAEALKDIGTPEALDAVKEFEKRRWWPF